MLKLRAHPKGAHHTIVITLTRGTHFYEWGMFYEDDFDVVLERKEVFASKAEALAYFNKYANHYYTSDRFDAVVTYDFGGDLDD